MERTAENDFSKGSVVKNILGLAVPMTLAQLINVLYNIVDRIYIGRIPEHATLSLTGIGLSLPMITMVIAFANLFGMGGAPLCSIERGRGNLEEAEKIMGNSFTMLVVFGVFLTMLGLLFKKPLLYAFGASDSTYPFADAYITIYLLGSIFVMVGLGMNSFINSQGFGKVGMCTVLLGAVANIILDPIFIFGLGMGVRGAALATIISQFFFRCLDCAFPDRKKNHTAPPAVLPASAVEENPGHCGTGNERFYHGNHQLYRADRVQCDASDIRRGSLCGRYDSHQLPAGGGVHAGAGRHKQRPAGYGL